MSMLKLRKILRTFYKFQVVMCKYHTVFLTPEGRVYTCGHGQGGRLGHPTEETCLVSYIFAISRIAVDTGKVEDFCIAFWKILM